MANKDKNKMREQTRNRVRFFRGIQSILKHDNISIVNAVQLRKKIDKSNLSTSNEKEIEPPSLSDELKSWALKFHTKRRALTALLKLLRSFGVQSLPKDSRCLLKTPRVIEIEVRSGGQYWHNGLIKEISRVFGKLSCDLRVQINLNMDGLPLCKSSLKTFWPILVNFHGTLSFIFKRVV